MLAGVEESGSDVEPPNSCFLAEMRGGVEGCTYESRAVAGARRVLRRRRDYKWMVEVVWNGKGACDLTGAHDFAAKFECEGGISAGVFRHASPVFALSSPLLAHGAARRHRLRFNGGNVKDAARFAHFNTACERHAWKYLRCDGIKARNSDACRHIFTFTERQKWSFTPKSALFSQLNALLFCYFRRSRRDFC